MKWIGILLIQILMFMTSAYGSITDVLATIPVQDGGRVKPFDSFARESLQLIYGRQKFQGKSATDVIFTWIMVPEYWAGTKFVQVRHKGVRDALGLESERIYYSPEELLQNDKLGLLFQDLKTTQKLQNKLNAYYQALQTLENQINVYHGIRMGQLLRLAPQEQGEAWVSVRDLKEEESTLFASIMKSFVKVLAVENNKEGLTEKDKAERETNLKEAVSGFVEHLRKKFPKKYGDGSEIAAELSLNRHRPFMWSWIFYLIGTVFIIAAWVNNRGLWYKLGWAATIVGFILHNYGFGLRVYVTGRGPVTNMYEVVIWTAYGAIVLAMILEAIWKSKITMAAAGLGATLFMILSDLAPAVLDPSLQPLQPVLRDNFWLLTHVLVIALSYAAFFLSFVLGDLLIFYYIRDEDKYKQQIKEGVKAIYRTMQIGVVLLTAGTILGGVWADYSWGRFWGWDPKETWALITILGYIAVLHGRLAGLIRDFGMVCSAVVTFSLVIMAAYGVNYVLGAGLHSYGFGAGGVEYVAGFIALHILYVSYVITVRRSRSQAASNS